MEAALTLHQRGLEALANVDTGAMTPTQIAQFLLRVQKQVDQLGVVHAKICAEAASANVHAGSGHRDLASWLAHNGKTSKGRAVRQQKLGEAISKSAKLEDALAKGELTPDAAGELLPTMDAPHSGNIDDLIDSCTGATPQQAREAGEMFRELNKPHGETDAEAEERKRAKRFLRLNNIGDGTTSINGLLPTTEARTVRDALASIVAMSNHTTDARTNEQKDADALVQLAHAHNAGTIHGGREAPHVMVVINIDDLLGSGFGFNEHNEIVPAEIVRRMMPYSWVTRLLTAGNVPINFGRKQRLATEEQYQTIIARDGGFCRMPGCCVPAMWCEVDHIQAWAAEHGPTDIDWLVLWCIRHHHDRHRPGVTLHGDANDLWMTLPNGDCIPLPSKKPVRTAAPMPLAYTSPSRPTKPTDLPPPSAAVPPGEPPPGQPGLFDGLRLFDEPSSPTGATGPPGRTAA